VPLEHRVSRADDRVAGRLAFPAAPHDLRAFGARISGGFPSRQSLTAEAVGRRPSSPYPLLQSARGSAGTVLRWSLLSWDWGPCCRCTSCASTPGSRSFRRTGAARRRSCSALVVSHHLDGLLRTGVAGLLHPATGWGFAAFRACRQMSRPRAARRAGDSPRGAVRTLRRVPSSAAGNASLRPLPSCRYRPARREVRPKPVPRRPLPR
jgi:hypothetical protein